MSALDLFALTVAALAGAPLPPLPALIGRVVRPLGEIPAGDPFAELWDARQAAETEPPPGDPDAAARADGAINEEQG